MERSMSCVLLLLCGLWSWVCPVPLTMHTEVGEEVTLEPQYSGDPSEINWKINGNKLVDMELKPRLDIFFYHLQDRATISPTDGRLTIKDLTVGDSGLYKAEALVNNVILGREINLIVRDEKVKLTSTSSMGPPNSSVTNEKVKLTSTSSMGPPNSSVTTSHTKGPSPRSTIPPLRVKQAGMSASTRVVIIVASLIVIGVFISCLLWCFCCGKKKKTDL
ncbi:uncharacterized protein LOC143981565 isoform X4 [Lithobates pipiens]